eukprot:TRINITY_DN3303_c0_g1_i6.p2 TRINITY_DN3303_c0_g1~~TRINITY_DN3303_c0_g1_i6.p2  ORF type:complete len:102 (+),score=33.76 TRINITY_DN3303_c0_g1_i6:78-383(+)
MCIRDSVQIDPDDIKELQKDSSLQKAAVCLVCGRMFMDKLDKHFASTKHRLYLQNKALVCKGCNHVIEQEKFTKEVNLLLDKANDAAISRLTKNMIKELAV